MRITIVLGPLNPPPPGPAGAVEKRWSRKASLFAQRGHEVTIICRDHPDLPQESVIDGVRYVPLPAARRLGTGWLDALRDFPYSRRARKALPSADITLTNCFWLPALLRGKGPWGALDVHIARVPKGQMWLYKHADRISTVSSYVADLIRKELPNDQGDKVRWITNPVDTEVFHPATSTGDPRRICFTGRVHPEKGVVELARAIKLLRRDDPSWRLLVVGDVDRDFGGGGERYRKQIVEAIGDANAIEFTGLVRDPQELARHIRSCRYYVYPSLAAQGEACPVAPLEALAAGVPPIVSELQQFLDYITPDENGLVVPMKPKGGDERLAQAIRDLDNDPARYDRLAARATTSAQPFAYDAVVDHYLADFQVLSAR